MLDKFVKGEGLSNPITYLDALSFQLSQYWKESNKRSNGAKIIQELQEDTPEGCYFEADKGSYFIPDEDIKHPYVTYLIVASNLNEIMPAGKMLIGLLNNQKTPNDLLVIRKWPEVTKRVHQKGYQIRIRCVSVSLKPNDTKTDNLVY